MKRMIYIISFVMGHGHGPKYLKRSKFFCFISLYTVIITLAGNSHTISNLKVCFLIEL